ncbi:MAG: TolC family protein [Verrucomicrobia bacterium]|nr:TolC family protein [Verrucomicrobiota bacterium]
MTVQSSKIKVHARVAALLLAALPSSFAQTSTPAALHPIDLPTVLQLAGAQNIDVQIARERLAEARANRDIAVEQFFPWIAPGVGYRRHDGQLQDVTGTIFDASKQSYTLGGTLTAQVDLGDAYYKSLAAKQLVKAADHALDAQRRDSIAAAAQGYFDLVRAQAGAGVAREGTLIATDYAGQLHRAVEVGLAFKGDALRAQVEVGRTQLTLRQAVEKQRSAAARLAQLLRLDSTVELAAREGDLAPLVLVRTNAALDSLVAQALAKRPELLQTKALTHAAKEQHSGIVKGPLVPTLGAQVFLGGLGGGRNGSLGHFDDSQDYFLGLSWRIGPGGLFDAPRRKAAASRVNAALLGEEKARDEVIREVVEAHTRAQSLADQFAVARSAVAAAEETLKLTRERKEFAIGAVLETIQAEQDLTRTRNDLVIAIAEFNKAQYALQRAIGALGSEPATPEKSK